MARLSPYSDLALTQTYSVQRSGALIRSSLWIAITAVFTLASVVWPLHSLAAEESDDASVAAGEPVDSWYPRTVTSEKGTAVIYAPQIDAWTDFDSLIGWSAFGITEADTNTSWHGSVKFDAETDTDIVAREVLLHDVEILELTIEGLAEDSTEFQLIRDGLTSYSRTVPLDLVLEYLPQAIALPSSGKLNSEPPPIFVSNSPAILLSVDSEPVFLPLDETELQFVLNTNWDILRHGDDGPLYMCYASSWLSANELTGKWTWAASLPRDFSNIPDEDNWSNVTACLPDDLDNLVPPKKPAPAVFYATVPAELLLLDGDPVWHRIAEAGPDYATNTTQELFRVGDQTYFLVSGRWFQADGLDGPWTLARELPDAFREIPPEGSEGAHAKSYIRKSVPGTRESWEAALIASIPRKAKIVRGTESELDLDINYAGDPAFAPVEGTSIELAVNTSYQVFRYDENYYLCHNAVWFTAAAAEGPWHFADKVPDEFSSIPPTSPAYNTTFVNI